MASKDGQSQRIDVDKETPVFTQRYHLSGTSNRDNDVVESERASKDGQSQRIDVDKETSVFTQRYHLSGTSNRDNDVVESEWDAFGSSSEEESDGIANNEPKEAEFLSGILFRVVLQSMGGVRMDSQIGASSIVDVDVRPRVLVVHSNSESSTSTILAAKLLRGRFEQAGLAHQDPADEVDCRDYDCLVDTSALRAHENLPESYKYLREGGLLVAFLEETISVSSEQVSISAAAAKVLPSREWAVERARLGDANISEGERIKGGAAANVAAILMVRRRGVLVNEQCAVWKPSSRRALAEEQALCDAVTITRCTASVEAGTLSEADVADAVAALRTHGVVVIPRLFDPESTRRWGRIAIADLRHAVRRLREKALRGIPSASSSACGLSATSTLEGESEAVEEASARELLSGDFAVESLVGRNYHELAMREALRVDLRRGPRMLAHDTKVRSSKFKHRDANPDHKGLEAIFQQLMNPPPENSEQAAARQGNFGRWNFDGGGPSYGNVDESDETGHDQDGESQEKNTGVPLVSKTKGTSHSRVGVYWNPPPLNIGAVGAVVSLPGCADQAIHADIYHLFDGAHGLHLPPHYVNCFMPALDVPTTHEVRKRRLKRRLLRERAVETPRIDHNKDEIEKNLCAEDIEEAQLNREEEAQLERARLVGQTAFIVGSHRMAECARLMSGGGKRKGRGLDARNWTVKNGLVGGARGATDVGAGEGDALERARRLVRPLVEAGDCVIFDCRVLHFGCANRAHDSAVTPKPNVHMPAISAHKFWRPLLYANVTQNWFEDKKNWETEALFTSKDHTEADEEKLLKSSTRTSARVIEAKDLDDAYARCHKEGAICVMYSEGCPHSEELMNALEGSVFLRSFPEGHSICLLLNVAKIGDQDENSPFGSLVSKMPVQGVPFIFTLMDQQIYYRQGAFDVQAITFDEWLVSAEAALFF